MKITMIASLVLFVTSLLGALIAGVNQFWCSFGFFLLTCVSALMGVHFATLVGRFDKKFQRLEKLIQEGKSEEIA